MSREQEIDKLRKCFGDDRLIAESVGKGCTGVYRGLIVHPVVSGTISGTPRVRLAVTGQYFDERARFYSLDETIHAIDTYWDDSIPKVERSEAYRMGLSWQEVEELNTAVVDLADDANDEAFGDSTDRDYEDFKERAYYDESYFDQESWRFRIDKSDPRLGKLRRFAVRHGFKEPFLDLVVRQWVCDYRMENGPIDAIYELGDRYNGARFVDVDRLLADHKKGLAGKSKAGTKPAKGRTLERKGKATATDAGKSKPGKVPSTKQGKTVSGKAPKESVKASDRSEKKKDDSKADGGPKKSTVRSEPSGGKGKAGNAPGKKKSERSASEIQSGRSTRAQTLDSKRRAKKTFPADYTDEQYALWAANPGRYDIEGIDTPKKVGSAQRRSSGSVGSRSTKSGVYTKQDWSRDRKFSAQPGQEVSAEVYEEMQYNGSPRYIPTALLERYGCIRGFLTGTMFADPEMYGAFGETADGRFLYLGLSKARKSYREGPATWMDDFYHEPKKKSAKKGASMASKARKSKVSTQPRNKQGRFMSREMAERPRKANGQFKKRTGARR